MELPELFRSKSSGGFEALKAFACEEWHLDILCSEEEMLPAYDDRNLQSEEVMHAHESNEVARYATLNPQAFIFLASSFVWGQNMKYLENKAKRISFRDIRDLTSTDATRINSELHDCREDLDYLIKSVIYSHDRIPAHLTSYYDEFPRIRWRHNTTYLSPIDHHKTILANAKDLEKFLIDSFQMLMSSVSVRQAAISNELSIATTDLARDTATQASASAFVYIPLTFVTGIFGMNIRTGSEAPNGFIWYAPLVTLAVALFFTIALWYVASWIEKRFAERREKHRLDIEGGRGSKAKSE